MVACRSRDPPKWDGQRPKQPWNPKQQTKQPKGADGIAGAHSDKNQQILSIYAGYTATNNNIDQIFTSQTNNARLLKHANAEPWISGPNVARTAAEATCRARAASPAAVRRAARRAARVGEVGPRAGALQSRKHGQSSGQSSEIGVWQLGSYIDDLSLDS